MYPAHGGAHKLAMKNGLPYLSKELFWQAMEDISTQATLISGHSWTELRDMIEAQVPEAQPNLLNQGSDSAYCSFSIAPTDHFKVKRAKIALFEELHAAPNPNRGRLSGSTRSLTFGAQTGRGSDRSCVINRTADIKYAHLMDLVHQLAQKFQNAEGPALPYPGFQILKLEVGQNLNQHRDYHNHPDYPNHTMKFGSIREAHCRSCEMVCGVLMTRKVNGCRLML